MLEYVRAENFEKFPELFVQFGDGLNAIVGPSDAGKTAVINMLAWVCTNRPSGDEFRTWGSKRTCVEIGIDGHKVRRVKSNSENYYELDEDRLYFGRSTDVPKAVADLLNVSDINFHRQHDKHFLLSESSPEVGRFINRIVNLEVMDSTMTFAKQQLTSVRDKIKANGIERKRNDLQLQKYDWLDGFGAKLERIEKRKQLLDIKRQDYINVCHLASDWEQIEQQLEKFNGLDKLSAKCGRLLSRYNALMQDDQEFSDTHELVEEGYDITDQLENIEPLVKLKPKVESLLKRVSTLDKDREQYQDVFNLVADWRRLQKTSVETERSLKSLHKEFDRLFPEKCPLCGK